MKSKPHAVVAVSVAPSRIHSSTRGILPGPSLRSVSVLLLLSLISGWLPAARASDPIGVYAIVDRVVLEPADGPAKRAQIWGKFSFARGSGNTYAKPEAGYLYYTLGEEKPEIARNEWNDLKSIAGKGECVGFGSRYREKGKVRDPKMAPSNPDAYLPGFGLNRMRQDTEYPPVRELYAMLVAAWPTEGDAIPAGKVTLRATRSTPNLLSDAKVVFEIESESGEKEISPPLAAAGSEISWAPSLSLKKGTVVSWKARTILGEWTGPVTATRFKVKP